MKVKILCNPGKFFFRWSGSAQESHPLEHFHYIQLCVAKIFTLSAARCIILLFMGKFFLLQICIWWMKNALKDGGSSTLYSVQVRDKVDRAERKRGWR